MQKEWSRDDLIRVAKRENNTKRSFLYVNPLQGKHMPVSPRETLSLFDQLAKKAEQRYEGERVMVIGFAETATAIGAAIALRVSNATCFLHTTREDIRPFSPAFLYFTESHSHAVDQKLALKGLADYVEAVDRIVFAEDEVTTGNTIEKLICRLEEAFPRQQLRFGILSVMNSMSEERLQELEKRGVFIDCLCRVPAGYRTDETERYTYEQLRRTFFPAPEKEVCTFRLEEGWNARVVEKTDCIREKCEVFSEQVMKMLKSSLAVPEWDGISSVLVLGTEECMYPGLLLGAKIEENRPGVRVRFHATTRSPLEISRDPAYPLHERIPLDSVYEKGRATFLYNPDRYDLVLVVTDASDGMENGRGKDSLTGALSAYGNERIIWINWEYTAG